MPTCTPIAVTAIPTTAAAPSRCGLQLPTPVAAMNAVGIRPTRGDFGLPDARIIKPGDPYASTLYFRMAKFGRDRMPHIGSERPDEGGLDLIAQWIAGMNEGAEETDRGPGQRAARHVADQPKVCAAAGAKARTRRAGRRRARRVAGRGSEAPERSDSRLVRGLSATETSQTERKLGSNPRPRAVLASTAIPAGGRRCSGRGRSSAAVATVSATEARRSGRTYRPSESFVRVRNCSTVSWSRRAGSSRSTPPMPS